MCVFMRVSLSGCQDYHVCACVCVCVCVCVTQHSLNVMSVFNETAMSRFIIIETRYVIFLMSWYRVYNTLCVCVCVCVCFFSLWSNRNVLFVFYWLIVILRCILKWKFCNFNIIAWMMVLYLKWHFECALACEYIETIVCHNWKHSRRLGTKCLCSDNGMPLSLCCHGNVTPLSTRVGG